MAYTPSSVFAAWASDFGQFLIQPVRWLTGSERSDTFVLDDLGPAFWELATLARSVGQKAERTRNTTLRRRRSERAAFNDAT